MKHKILKVTADQKIQAQNMLLDCMDKKTLQIETPFEHQVAEQLIQSGIAEIVSKKNYGRIASIKGI